MYNSLVSKKIELQNAIIKLENVFPTNDLIITYADFLKVKHYLGSYQFNPAVFQNILCLINTLWKSNKRINRLVLLIKLREYLNTKDPDQQTSPHSRSFEFTNTLSLDIRKQLFELFTNIFDHPSHISSKQLEEARKYSNNLLINVGLTAVEEDWLCINADKSPHILNRILRYPIKSTIISKWARENFNNISFVTRRAELISWIIDEEPTFEVSSQQLLDDFENMNQLDRQAIQSYKDDTYANQIMERELGDILPRIKYNDVETGEIREGRVDLDSPELKLIRRPYAYPIDMNSDLFQHIPDFNKMSQEFYNQIELFKMKTMIWGIAYSRLDNESKSGLLKKYYCAETYHSLFKASKKIKNVEILKWLLEQLDIN